jgi:hypothetical protein
MEITESGGQVVRSELGYNSYVVDRATAESMAESYCKILDAVLHDSNTPIEDLAEKLEVLGAEREEIAL